MTTPARGAPLRSAGGFAPRPSLSSYTTPGDTTLQSVRTGFVSGFHATERLLTDQHAVEVETLRNRVAALEAEAAEAEAAIDEADARFDEVSAVRDALRERVTTAETEVARLRGMVDVLQGLVDRHLSADDADPSIEQSAPAPARRRRSPSLSAASETSPLAS
jgi:hypothetical protein